MARHRGIYKPDHESPYEVSRSRIEAFIKCPACFWLDRVKGDQQCEYATFLQGLEEVFNGSV